MKRNREAVCTSSKCRSGINDEQEIMQLTQGVPGGLNNHLNSYTGTPTQDMIWNWESNLNAGTWVMIKKFNDEKTYEDKFTQDTGFYYPTPEQQEMNVWQRYNGCLTKGRGCYYVWNSSLGHWIMNTTLCLEQNNKCSGAFPSGGKCYADCARYWSQQPQLQCK